MGLSDNDPDIRDFVAAFVEDLARSGWIDGRNARIRQASRQKRQERPHPDTIVHGKFLGSFHLVAPVAMKSWGASLVFKYF